MIKKILLLFFILVLVVLLVAGGYVYRCISSAPVIDTSDIYSLLEQKSILYDKDGAQIDTLAFTDGDRVIVSYDQMPQDLVNAMVAIEDKTFWEHHGFNFIRMIGAVKERIMDGGQIGGTSTITQQLARNIYLSETKSERTIKRKIIEAYYTVQIEDALSKQAILEAYMNTVYFGFGSYGVQTAAQNYFGKNVEDLDLIECAALAALPQAPDAYALCYVDYDHDSSLPVIKKSGDLSYVYNGDVSQNRRNQVLFNMKEEGRITEEQRQGALSEDLQSHMKISVKSKVKDDMSYFTDYAIEQVKKDLQKEVGLSEEKAAQMLYSGGLNIYTTLDQSKQKILSEEFRDPLNYTSVAWYSTDSEGNIITRRGSIFLYAYDNIYNSKGGVHFHPDEYERTDSGDVVLKKGGRFSFYEDTSEGGSKAAIAVPDVYRLKDGAFYILQDGRVDIPSEYLKINGDGDCVISSRIFDADPQVASESDDGIKVKKAFCLKGSESRQPQAAAVLIENSTGYIRAMMGGRGTSGRMQFNRAIKPHQPGSSIKPIGVYGPALQKSADLAKDGEKMDLDFSKGDYWGDYITAASVINDAPMYTNGRRWPQNAYSGYRGKMTLRKAVQQSVNVCAVKVFKQIGEDYAIGMLKKNGITSIVEEGETNDINTASLSLGGMTTGISPLELSAAYETFVNGGTYKEPLCYTKITDRNGDLVLEREQKTTKVYDENVAWIMTDILHSVVTRGIATNARISSQPVGGKTGTTSDQYDIWFAGFTPQYTMALWEGTDVHIRLSSMSEAAASFWSSVMGRVCEGLDYEDFPERPEGVVVSRGEYFAEGTVGGKYPATDDDKKKKDEEDKKKEKKSTTSKPNNGGSSGSSGSYGSDVTDSEKEFLDEFFH